MTFGFVSIRLRPLMYVKLTNKSVTYVSGTFVTLDTGLNKRGQGGIFQRGEPERMLDNLPVTSQFYLLHSTKTPERKGPRGDSAG